MNIQVGFCINNSFHFSEIKVQLLGHAVVLCLVLSEATKLFSRWLYHLTFPLVVYEKSSFSVSSPAFDVVIIFYSSYSDRYVVIPHFGLCISLKATDIQHLLNSLFAICMPSWVKCLFMCYAFPN